jgi:hypothetical protein
MAQRTKANFKATKNSRFANNSTGQIGADDSQDMYEDVADSAMFLEDNFIDEDSFATDSATKAPSQQSTKAYIAAQLAGGSTQSVTVSVSSAEILALFTTPKQIIAAPGAGKYIQVLSAYVFLDFASAYSNTNTELRYATGQSISGAITSFLNGGSDTIANYPAGGGSGIFAFSQVENSAINYLAPSANPTGGTSTISINVIYRTVTV